MNTKQVGVKLNQFKSSTPSFSYNQLKFKFSKIKSNSYRNVCFCTESLIEVIINYHCSQRSEKNTELIDLSKLIENVGRYKYKIKQLLEKYLFHLPVRIKLKNDNKIGTSTVTLKELILSKKTS